MKRLLKLLARLYPSAWRNRYAAEFEALLDDRAPRLRDTFDVLLGALKMQMIRPSFARITLASCLFGLLAALAISFAVPAEYVSQSLILVGAGMDPAGHALGNGAPPDIDTVLPGTINDALASDSLAAIIQKYNLYPHESAGTPPDAAINEMRKNIAIERVQRPAASPGLPGFVIDFSYPDPHIAQQVDASLVSLFVQSNLRRRITSAPDDGPRQRGEVFMVMDAASLPQKPTFPKRSLFGVGGLLAGLVAGLTLAAFLRSGRSRTAAGN